MSSRSRPWSASSEANGDAQERGLPDSGSPCLFGQGGNMFTPVHSPDDLDATPLSKRRKTEPTLSSCVEPALSSCVEPSLSSCVEPTLEDTANTFARLRNHLQSLEQSLEARQVAFDSVKAQLKSSQAEVYTHKTQEYLLEAQLHEEQLMGAATIGELERNVSELELKVAVLELRLAGFDKYKREAEVAVRMNNTYRDLLARERAKVRRLRDDYLAMGDQIEDLEDLPGSSKDGTLSWASEAGHSHDDGLERVMDASDVSDAEIDG